MPPVSKTLMDYPYQTDMANIFAIGRDHQSLLRSTGHLFRDGRWLGDDDPFHVYREIENPGLGAGLAVRASAHWKRYDPGISAINDQSTTYNWRPAILRGFTWDDYYDSGTQDLPEVVEPSYSDVVLDLNAKGTSYIRRFRPGNPAGPLGQFLIELRDLPHIPLLLRSRAVHFRDLGGEYLNQEFGWIPFVQDVIKIGHTQLRMQSILDKLVKNNGIRIKRRSKRNEVTTGGDPTFYDYDKPFPFWLGNNGTSDVPEMSDFYLMGPTFSGLDRTFEGELTLSLENKVVTEDWFVGTFVYYVPDIGSSRWTDKAKNVLSGASITPDLLYKVYPWTWLADWFANVGDIVSNLTQNAVDNEVLMDAHIMETITDSTKIEAHVTWNALDITTLDHKAVLSYDPGSDKLSYSLIKKQKIRQKSSPFGFGLKTGDFTFHQGSILAALLFSKGR